MNLTTLKYLFLVVHAKYQFENIFQELSNITFPSLKRLFVEHRCEGKNGVSVTEKTLEKLVKNAPNLKNLIFQSSIDCVSQITHEFIFKMLNDEDLAIIVQSLDVDRDKGYEYEKNINDFLKGKHGNWQPRDSQPDAMLAAAGGFLFSRRIGWGRAGVGCSSL